MPSSAKFRETAMSDHHAATAMYRLRTPGIFRQPTIRRNLI
jgi:hypothetical protein